MGIAFIDADFRIKAVGLDVAEGSSIYREARAGTARGRSAVARTEVSNRGPSVSLRLFRKIGPRRREDVGV